MTTSPNLILSFLTQLFLIFSLSIAALRPDFYDLICPQALSTIRPMIETTILNEPRMGASLVRLHFLDCFVNGCDGSVLLDDTATMKGEKTAEQNNNSIRGFEVIDKIKSTLNDVCKGNKVSCADILAVAARDSISVLGGPSYSVLLGRRDATSASLDAANSNIPSPNFDKSQLISNFNSHGLSVNDLVVLSGAHTIGFARCTSFRNRIYNDTNIEPKFAEGLRSICPKSGNDDALATLDDTAEVDTHYYKNLLGFKGLLGSDQQLFQGDGSETDGLVEYYSNLDVFFGDFGEAMIKMGDLSPLTGNDGEIRKNCRFVNGEGLFSSI